MKYLNWILAIVLISGVTYARTRVPDYGVSVLTNSSWQVLTTEDTLTETIETLDNSLYSTDQSYASVSNQIGNLSGRVVVAESDIIVNASSSASNALDIIAVSNIAQSAYDVTEAVTNITGGVYDPTAGTLTLPKYSFEAWFSANDDLISVTNIWAVPGSATFYPLGYDPYADSGNWWDRFPIYSLSRSDTNVVYFGNPATTNAFRYVVPVDGWYHFTCRSRTISQGDIGAWLGMVKNNDFSIGNTTNTMWDQPTWASTGYNSMSASWTPFLKADDIIRFFLFRTSAGVAATNVFVYVGGSLISAESSQ